MRSGLPSMCPPTLLRHLVVLTAMLAPIGCQPAPQSEPTAPSMRATDRTPADPAHASTTNDHQADEPMPYNELTPAEQRVILQKGTEPPWTGEYTESKDAGTYVCRRCNAELYRSTDKFDSHCGWPSFDDEIDGAVTRHPDPDGSRTEIVCTNCGAHLGHVFLGEGFTERNTRHCVNSISMSFVPAGQPLPQPIVR